ncbi:hypothetical protein [Methylobacterium sp. yr596]|uniref:hypothetical protein n=1 Tax=Methylobacterium sp. yr596 TaxID=1761800 RepID=UPI0008E1798C|nr:hypothetical protein [Methylobacterium sp. yr596]SFF22237.1 hypothetical protein SAMN04487844_1124 [Methylobacterium sp. yr596]
MKKPSDLIGPLIRFAFCCRSCAAPRPGSNFLPLLALASDDETVFVDGEEMEALYRAGLLLAEPDDNGFVVEETDEYGGIDADYIWRVSPAGRAALQKEEAGR